MILIYGFSETENYAKKYSTRKIEFPRVLKALEINMKHLF